MADDKTEEPTPKKLEDARKKGQVFKSTEITQSILFLIAAATLSASGPLFVERLKSLMVESFNPKLLAGNPDPNLLKARIGMGFLQALLLSLPLLVLLAAAGALIGFAQIGGLLFALESLTPNLSKLNPVTGIQNRFFKAKAYVELVKTILKIVVAPWLAYLTIKSDLRELVVSSRVGLAQTAALVPQLLFALLYKLGGLFLVLGAADFFIQKKLFMKEMMMSKEEVKRENKEQEGDPELKGKRKELAMEFAMENAMARIPQANAVIVNPTHLAVALEYDEKTMNAPQIMAKGEMLVAQRIRKIAEENNVPVLRDVPLARSLYALEINQEVSDDLFEAVAEVLELASRLSGKDAN